MGERKKCLDCGKYDKFSKGLCLGCWKVQHAKPIRKISEKHQKTIDAYKIVKKNFFDKKRQADGKVLCEIKLEGCTKEATECHHSAGKSSKLQYLNEDDFIPTCRNCHRYVEEHPAFAKENGFSKNRL